MRFTSATQLNCLDEIQPSITTGQIANELGVDTKNAEANIRALKKSGLLKREGAKKNGRWIVK